MTLWYCVFDVYHFYNKDTTWKKYINISHIKLLIQNNFIAYTQYPKETTLNTLFYIRNVMCMRNMNNETRKDICSCMKTGKEQNLILN